MEEMIKLLIGVFVLALGWPIGNILARMTKEELKPGRKWIKLVVLVGLIGGFASLSFMNDILMFSFFFIAIVGSRCLR